MKTALLRLLTALRRGWLLFQIRSAEITIHDQSLAIAAVPDGLMRDQICLARELLFGELARLRAEYNATLPPGRRMTWGLA